MTKTVEAIYDAGVLKPLESLSLTDQQRVRVTVETIETAPAANSRANIQQLIDRLQRSSFSYGGTLPAREELHNRNDRV